MWSATFESTNNGIFLPRTKSAGLPPDLIVLFSDADVLTTSTIPLKLQNAFPKCKVVGCSTGTSLANNALSDTSISGIAIGFDSSRVELASVEISNPNECFQIGAELGKKLKAQDLVSVLVLSDGLKVNGSDIVGGMLSMLGSRVTVFGGLAGDGARFEKTILVENGNAIENHVLAIGFYGKKLMISHGSDGGWHDYGQEWEITKSNGNMLQELNGQNAYETYAQILGDKAKDLPTSGLLYPVRIWHPDYPQHDVVRTLLSVDKDAGTLTFAGDVPLGWHAALLIGGKSDLIDGATSSSIKALENFHAISGDIDPQICFMVSCVGRRLLLGEQTIDEVSEVLAILPQNIGLLGFYSYGEIAPHKMTKLCSLHNQTLTLTLMAETR